MKWKNATIDSVPEDNQEVKITVFGINYIAVYKSANRSFQVKDSPLIFFNAEQIIYWMEIPEQNII